MNSISETQTPQSEEHDGCRHRRCRTHALKFVAIFAVVIVLKGVFTMLLWNWLVPDLFHGPVLNFPQAIGLVVLAKLILGFKDMRHFEPGGRGRHHHGHGRWSSLSKEEREKIREHLRK